MPFPIIDIHVHSTLKPYGHSSYPNENLKDSASEACIWYSDPPSVGDQLLENTIGFPRFRQSDFTSLVKGGANVAIVSLYPVEVSFVKPKVSPFVANWLVNLISLFGRKRIEDIKNPSFNYFQDLKREYDFLLALNNATPANSTRKYRLIASSVDLSESASNALLIITSIEGAHVFCDGNNVEDDASWQNIAANVQTVKQWQHPPFFVTLNHHFYNSLSSHAQSLYDIVARLLDQSHKMDQPVSGNKYITPRGYQLIDLLYSSQNGRKILLDIKHMAKATRQEFYAYRSQRYPNVPIICSHTGVAAFYNERINMDDEDIREIFNSKGLIGIELDQRILGFNNRGHRFVNWAKDIFRSKRKKEYRWAECFWNNIRYVAEKCYSFDPQQNPWKIICLGSDLDGVINPLNQFRTATDYQRLADALLLHIQDYWSSGTSTIPAGHLGLDAHNVVYQIMYSNAFYFIQDNYK